jgi:hypothetical protein
MPLKKEQKFSEINDPKKTAKKGAKNSQKRGKK